MVIIMITINQLVNIDDVLSSQVELVGRIDLSDSLVQVVSTNLTQVEQVEVEVITLGNHWLPVRIVLQLSTHILVSVLRLLGNGQNVEVVVVLWNDGNPEHSWSLSFLVSLRNLNHDLVTSNKTRDATCFSLITVLGYTFVNTQC